MEIKPLYKESTIIDYGNGEQSLDRDFIVYEASLEDVYHTIRMGETIESIAYQWYNSHESWYVIADANPLIDIFELVIGEVLIIPNPNKLNS